MKNKITLKQKLIIYSAGMLLLALSIQAIFNYLNSSKLIVEQVEASSNKSLKNMQEEIYSYTMASILAEKNGETRLKNKIFQSRDLCLRALDTNSVCAKSVRRNEEKNGQKQICSYAAYGLEQL